MEGFLVSLAVFGCLFGIYVFLRKSQQRELENAVREGLLPQGKRPPTMDNVHKLARSGHKMLAIKVYRQVNHHATLADAKAAVEAMAAPEKPKA